MSTELKEAEYTSPLGMSDEDLLNADPSTWFNNSQESNDEEEPEDTDDDDDDTSTEEAEQENSEEESEVKLNESDDDDVTDAEDFQKGSTEQSVEQTASKPESDNETSIEIDYRKEYERLTAPFKANGREIAVKSVDDAIALMQMGANYNKKMAALKPNLKLLKLLENNGLLDEAKLSFLIDLEKKNPEAINKLVKDSGMDPMDLDADKASDYKPTAYSVSDKEIELDTVLEEIQDSSAYTRTLDVIGSKWDKASKSIVADQPQLIKVINDHIERGIYDIIAQEIERERTFGRLNGLSDLEAYRQVGDAIQARGGFNHLGRQGHQNNPSLRTVVPNPKKEDDSKLREKKRAASSTKPAIPSRKPNDFNPLALSDEEFSKLVNEKFL